MFRYLFLELWEYFGVNQFLILEVAEVLRRLQDSKSKTSVCAGVIRVHPFFLVKHFEEKTAVQSDLFTWPFLCL